MKVSSWTRPTLGWKLSCETDKGYTRQDGIEAASTHIDLSEKAAKFDNLGVGMIIVYCVLTCLHVVVHYVPITHCCALLLYLIFLPIAWTRVPEVMKENRENIEKLEDFTALNECADKYTGIDVERVDNELDGAYDALHTLNFWIKLSFGVYIGEVILIFVVIFFFICTTCCKERRSHHDHDDYMRSDSERSVIDSDAKSVGKMSEASVSSYVKPAAG